MQKRAGTLAEVLDLEVLDRDLFRGRHPHDEATRLFGGQVASQALRAAGLTVPDHRLPHSCHGYFLRPGRRDLPVILHVDRDRDGGSFSARHVRAVQDGAVIFSMLASFTTVRSGGELDCLPTLDLPAPTDQPDVIRSHLLQARHPGGDQLWSSMWIRVPDPLPDDPMIRACAVAYLSDFGSGFGPQHDSGVGRGGPSVDHAIWFRGDLDPTDWLLLHLHPAAASGGLGVYTGSIRDRDGNLGAVLAQDQLLVRTPADVPPQR